MKSPAPITPPALVISAVIIIALFLLTPPAASGGQAPSLLWKAKALESVERMGPLGDALKKVTKKWDSPEAKRLKCEAMVEAAFAIHLSPEFSATVHKTEGTLDFFKLILNGGADGLFDLTYVYEGYTHKATKVMNLPKNWEVIFPTNVKDLGLIVVPGACTIAISFADPFFYQVVEK
jgi:hypothetical protein